MSESKPLVNLGDISKPVTTLIEKISDAIGGIYRPYQIRRVADAKAYADKLEAQTQIQVQQLQRRAVERFLAEEAKKQQNIEAITTKAITHVADSAQPERLQEDWITNFFDKCRLVSDEEMQTLWAAILSGEANSPGKFSKRTVNLLGDLDKADAALFQSLCSYCADLGSPTPLIYEPGDAIYGAQGLHFTALTHLDSIGLIRFEPLGGFRRQGLGKKGWVPYFGQRIWIELPGNEPCTIDIGKVLLTQAGQQLAPIVGAKECSGFPDYLRDKWRSLKYQTDPQAPQTPAP